MKQQTHHVITSRVGGYTVFTTVDDYGADWRENMEPDDGVTAQYLMTTFVHFPSGNRQESNHATSIPVSFHEAALWHDRFLQQLHGIEGPG